MEDQENGKINQYPKFVAKVNALMPVAFLTTLLCFLISGTLKPELFDKEAFIALMGGLVGAAATAANVNRDGD